MESIGEKLRQTRESKGYTIEQIARDTHIAKRFLEALEDENFGIFPGDPYLLGFMRTYSGYLGLDPEEIVTLYRNLKLQEQPAPIDELISKPASGSPGKLIAVIAAIVVVLGVGAYFLFSSGILDRDPAQVRNQPEPDVPPAQGTVFELTGEWVEQRFAEGDRIVVPVGDQSFGVDLVRVSDGLTISGPAGETQLIVDEESAVDLNQDSRPDVRFILRSVDTLDSPSTVVMRVNRGAVEQRPTVASSPESEVATEVAAGGNVVAEFAEREEYFVEVRFEGYSLFRYEVDEEPRVEQYFQQGQTLRTSVRDQFRLWVSNAGVARVRVAGQDIVLGEDGEVIAAEITWVEDPDSSNVRLALVPVN